MLFLGVTVYIFFLVLGGGVLNTDADLVVGGDADLVVGGDADLVEFFFPFVLRFLVLTGIYIYIEHILQIIDNPCFVSCFSLSLIMKYKNMKGGLQCDS